MRNIEFYASFLGGKEILECRQIKGRLISQATESNGAFLYQRISNLLKRARDS